MLKSLGVQNFKAFGEWADLDLSPITLIFGVNSAGKTSILHSLYLLKQTRANRESGALLLPRAQPGIVDLGSFQEFLFDHDLGRSMSFQLTVDRPELNSAPERRGGPIGPHALRLSFRRPTEAADVSLERISLINGDNQRAIAHFRLAGEEVIRPYPGHWATPFGRRRNPAMPLKVAACEWLTDDPDFWRSSFDGLKSNQEYIYETFRRLEQRAAIGEETSEDLDFDDFDVMKPEERQKYIKGLNDAIAFYSRPADLDTYVKRMSTIQLNSRVGLDGFMPVSRAPSEMFREDTVYYQKTNPPHDAFWRPPDIVSLLLRTAADVEDALERLYPLGPFRKPPERWYIFTGTSPEDVGYRGDLLPDLLFRHPDLVLDTNHWLNRLGTGHELNIQPVVATKDLFEVRLVDKRRKNGIEVGLLDVGFGISQLLPFIVQSLGSKEKTISIEQPEVHLHPRLQANLGDLISEAIREPRNNRFLIETHSEHLILRLQRLVRLHRLAPEDVSVVYVSRGPDGSRVERLHLDSNGDFAEEWPEGFFPERLHELN